MIDGDVGGVVSLMTTRRIDGGHMLDETTISCGTLTWCIQNPRCVMHVCTHTRLENVSGIIESITLPTHIRVHTLVVSTARQLSSVFGSGIDSFLKMSEYSSGVIDSRRRAGPGGPLKLKNVGFWVLRERGNCTRAEGEGISFSTRTF